MEWETLTKIQKCKRTACIHAVELPLILTIALSTTIAIVELNIVSCEHAKKCLSTVLLLGLTNVTQSCQFQCSQSSQTDWCDMYDLHKLGWKDFQKLCLTVMEVILGQTVESFLDSHDGGRDGAFTGKWTATGQEDLRGSVRDPV